MGTVRDIFVCELKIIKIISENMHGLLIGFYQLNYQIYRLHFLLVSRTITAHDICHALMDPNLNIMRNNAFHPKSFVDLILRKIFYQIYFVVHGQDVKR